MIGCWIVCVFVCVCVCVCVCMYVCSSITLGRLERFQPSLVHMAVCMCKNLKYILYLLSIIFSRENGVGGLHGIHPPPQGLPIAAAVTFTQIGIAATA
jgi:hypothetical protein